MPTIRPVEDYLQIGAELDEQLLAHTGLPGAHVYQHEHGQPTVEPVTFSYANQDYELRVQPDNPNLYSDRLYLPRFAGNLAVATGMRAEQPQTEEQKIANDLEDRLLADSIVLPRVTRHSESALASAIRVRRQTTTGGFREQANAAEQALAFIDSRIRIQGLRQSIERRHANLVAHLNGQRMPWVGES